MREPFANEQLSAWLDGELTEAEVAALERDMARDPALRAELDELLLVRDTLRAHGPARAPDGFLASVLAESDSEPMPGGRLAWLRRPFGIPLEGLAIAAAAVLVIVAGLNTGSDEASSPGSARPAQPAEEQAPPAVDATAEKGAEPASAEPSWRYQIVTSEPGTLADLSRLASKHDGVVRDKWGQKIPDGRIDPGDGSTYFVELPAAMFSAFDQGMRSLASGPAQAVTKAERAGPVVAQVDFLVIEPPVYDNAADAPLNTGKPAVEEDPKTAPYLVPQKKARAADKQAE